MTKPILDWETKGKMWLLRDDNVEHKDKDKYKYKYKDKDKCCSVVMLEGGEEQK